MFFNNLTKYFNNNYCKRNTLLKPQQQYSLVTYLPIDQVRPSTQLALDQATILILNPLNSMKSPFLVDDKSPYNPIIYSVL